MKNPLVYIKNGLRICVLKVRYGSRLHMGWIQSFEKIRLQIEKGASVVIGSYNQNREKMYVGVLNGGELSIGSHCFFNINSSITCVEKIVIGDNCKFGNNLVIIDHDHNYRANDIYSDDNPEFISSPVIIGNDVWIGANVVILRGTEIGDNCVIAAGSVVNGCIPPKTLYVQKRKKEMREVR